MYREPHAAAERLPSTVMGIYTKQRQHSNGVLAMVQRVELPGEWTTYDASIEQPPSQTGAISGSSVGQFRDDGEATTRADQAAHPSCPGTPPCGAWSDYVGLGWPPMPPGGG